VIDYFLVHIGYEQLYKIKLPLDDAVARLKSYSLLALLKTLARIDAAISLRSLDEFAEGHRLLLQGIMTPDQRAAIDAFRATEKHDEGVSPQYIVFHELQVLNAAKLALQHCGDEAENPASDLGPLAEALLIINDHLVPEAIFPQNYDDLTTEEQTECLLRFAVPNMVFNHGTRTLNLLSRWYDLFFIDAPSLTHRPEYVDVPGALQEVIGRDPKLFYRLATAFFTHWMRPKISGLSQWNPVLNIPTWLKDFTIDPAEYEAILAELASTREEFKGQWQARGRWEPYFFLPMQAKPFLRRDGELLCLSRRFAAEKISLGLYHLLLTKLPTSRGRDKFLTFFGFVFESYVNRLLGRAFPPFAKRYFPNVTNPETGDEIIDGVLDYGDSLVLIEAKSTLFSLPGLVSGDARVVEQKFEDIVYDAAKQLHNAVDAIKGGALESVGINAGRIKRYFPLVITLQFMPVEPITSRSVERTIADRGFLQASDIAPLQMAYIEDLERLEIALESGKSMADLLQEKVADQRLRDISFGNFLLEEVPEITSEHNRYLAERLRAIQQEALDFFKSREKNPAVS